MNTSVLTFQKNPNHDTFTQAFEWGRFFSEEALGYNLPLFPKTDLIIAKYHWIIAWAIMYRMLQESGRINIDFVEVIPHFRGKGIGVELIRRVEDVCSWRYTQVCASLNSSKNRYSKKIFAQAGFAYDGKYCFTK